MHSHRCEKVDSDWDMLRRLLVQGELSFGQMPSGVCMSRAVCCLSILTTLSGELVCELDVDASLDES